MMDQRDTLAQFKPLIQQIRAVLPPWRKLTFIMAICLFGLYVLSGIYVVQPNEQGVIRRFGRVINDQVMPGIHYRLPWPVEQIDRPKTLQVRVMSIGFRLIDKVKGLGPRPEETQLLTGDENIINVQMIVQYRVENPRTYLFAVEGPHWLVRKAAEAALTDIIGSMGVDQVLTTDKLIIQEKVKEQAQQVLDRYECGLRISGAYFQDINPSEEVAFAFRDVASAREDRNRLINEAHGYRNEKLPQVRGEAHKMIEEAQAEKTERVNRARGEADRFLALLSEYQRNRTVTGTRLYVETMEVILPKMRKYLLDKDKREGVVDLRLITAGQR